MSTDGISRRSFLKTSAAAAAAASLTSAIPAAAEDEGAFEPLPKAVILNMLPSELPLAERFQLAAECGFDGIEAAPMDDLDAAAEQGELARDAGVPIHSIIYGGWGNPLSHQDESVQEAGVEELRTALRSAEAMGADAVLLVPAVVNANVRYVEAYERSQRRIREVLPLAEELGIVIAVENVWNNFLLSPIEFAQYVDEFENPWLRAYFDVGNIVAFGWPEDWIRTLGERIVKVHYKDFIRDGREWVNLTEGDVNWAEVRQAFEEVGYTDFVTAEVSGGDQEHLTDLADRMERINRGLV